MNTRDALHPLRLATAFSGLIPAAFAQATTSPIATDRPGFLFSASLLPEDRWQIETGLPTYTRVRSDGAETRLWNLPIAARYGLSDRVELRASLPTWNDARVESSNSTTTDDGFSDVDIGAKFALDASSDAPLALQASLRLPTGADDFTNDEVGGAIHVMHSRALDDGYSVTGMLGATYAPIGGGDDPLAGAIAALVSKSFVDGWSGYGEVALFPGLHDGAGQAYAGGGLVWTVRADVQLDLSADFGLDDDSADVIAAFGVSVRF